MGRPALVEGSALVRSRRCRDSLERAAGIEIERCRFLHLGAQAVTMSGGAHRVEGNVVDDVSGGGIELGSDPVQACQGDRVYMSIVAEAGLEAEFRAIAGAD